MYSLPTIYFVQIIILIYYSDTWIVIKSSRAFNSIFSERKVNDSDNFYRIIDHRITVTLSEILDLSNEMTKLVAPRSLYCSKLRNVWTLCSYTWVFGFRLTQHDVMCFDVKDISRKFCFQVYGRKWVWERTFPKSYYLSAILHASYFVNYWLKSGIKCHWVIGDKGR